MEETYYSEETKIDLLEVQREFLKRGININLEQAKEIWSTYCQEVHYASWLPVALSDDEFQEEMLPIAKEILNI